MKRTLITAPADTPVSTTQVKAQTVITYSDDDTLLGVLIDAATDMAEQYTGRSLMPQTWDYHFDGFPTRIEIASFPVTAVTHVKYIDQAGDEQTLSTSNYWSDIQMFPTRIIPVTSWPATYLDRPNTVTVRLVEGYADADSIPAGIRQAILMIIAHLYENREAATDRTITEVPMGAQFLLDQWKLRL